MFSCRIRGKVVNSARDSSVVSVPLTRWHGDVEWKQVVVHYSNYGLWKLDDDIEVTGQMEICRSTDSNYGDDLHIVCVTSWKKITAGIL